MTMIEKDVQYYVEKGKKIVDRIEKKRENMRKKKFDTIAVHGLYSLEDALENNGSIIEPIYMSSAQQYENSNHLEAAQEQKIPSWIYTRIANPTLSYVEETIAMLEGYKLSGKTSAVLTSSGMAAVFMATNPFMANCEGCNIVVDARCYGGTFTIFNERYRGERGVEIRWVKNSLDLSEWEEKMDEKTRFVYAEIPANPSLNLTDVKALSEIAHKKGISVIVDSTLATPALFRPLEHDADIVVHSVSKAMAASGSVIAGAIISKNDIVSNFLSEEIKKDFVTYVKFQPMRDHGTALSPISAYFVLNDLRSLRSRVDLMSQNTMKVAEFLNSLDQVEGVSYPGLESHPGHSLAKSLMKLADSVDENGEEINRYGYLLSFNVKGGHQAARDLLDQFKIIWTATDLGRVKSVATIPTISTHRQQGDEGRKLASLPSNLIRFSVGIEDVEDIIGDLDQAFKAIQTKAQLSHK
ncbi:aminotransferase class I/II-fold pyridoxal phosphate-dependent enzyme [Peribacillus sp. NPDC006672]|uniref:aminotransferase class I/II-fold pyridoxal phosphate-dependent enzyme n=1 Tax=Peribacillus sp. NPDC006672 TaxID=3390606 RepID=UPI003D02477C